MEPNLTAEKDIPAAYEPAIPTLNGVGEFANVTIETENQASMAYAYVLVNQEIVGDLRNGCLTIRVYAGDVISVDAQKYGRIAFFYLKELPSCLDPDYLQESISCYQSINHFGTAVFVQ